MLKPIPTIPEGISSYLFVRMCADMSPDDGSEWCDFKALDNLPPYSCKYVLDPDTPLVFRRPPGTEDFTIVKLPLSAALECLEEDERFNLNPARWDRVKRQLSEGGCEYPWMSALPGGRPMLQDGRHRIVAMMRLLGKTTAPFIVEKRHLASIKAWPAFQLPQS
jgi:hypothetical protein